MCDTPPKQDKKTDNFAADERNWNGENVNKRNTGDEEENRRPSRNKKTDNYNIHSTNCDDVVNWRSRKTVDHESVNFRKQFSPQRPLSKKQHGGTPTNLEKFPQSFNTENVNNTHKARNRPAAHQNSRYPLTRSSAEFDATASTPMRCERQYGRHQGAPPLRQWRGNVSRGGGDLSISTSLSRASGLFTPEEAERLDNRNKWNCRNFIPNQGRERSSSSVSSNSATGIQPMHPSEMGDGFMMHFAKQVSTPGLLTRRKHRKLRIACPVTIPGAMLVGEGSRPVGEAAFNYFYFAKDSEHPNAAGGRKLFSPEGGMCDMWGSCIQMVLDCLVCPEVVHPFAGKIFNYMAEKELGFLKSDVIRLKCKGLSHTGSNFYGTAYEGVTPRDNEKIKFLRRWVRRYAATLRAFEEEVRLGRRVFGGMGCNRDQWKKLIVRKFNNRLENFDPSDFENVEAPEVCLREIRICRGGNNDMDYQADPRFPGYSIGSREVLSDIDGVSCRFVMADDAETQPVVMLPASHPHAQEPTSEQVQAAATAGTATETQADSSDTESKENNKSPDPPRETLYLDQQNKDQTELPRGTS